MMQGINLSLDLLETAVKVICYPTLVAIVWKASHRFYQIFSKFDKLCCTVNTIATNHLAHIQAALESGAERSAERDNRMLDEIKELRADFRAKQ